ncbi:MAG: polysaccharide deacetylase family protein [Flavobacteriales bacterium]|nr:polysaccharide deacetylase family protein [Flavobacteriales bacterium]
MFHGVVEEPSSWFSPRHVHVPAFEKQIAYLKENFRIISTEEAFHCQGTNERPDRPTITVSFDDGYANNLRNALPILSAYDIPVTFYVVGPCAEQESVRYLWPDLVATLVQVSKGAPLKIGGKNYVGVQDAAGGVSLIQRIKKVGPEERDELLDEIAARKDIKDFMTNLPEEVWRMMGPDELKALSSNPLVTIGSHGYGHYNLANIPLEDAERDMSHAKQVLETCIGRSVKELAFPDGSYSEEVIEAGRRSGYSHFMAVDLNAREHAGREDLLPRHGVSATTTWQSTMFFLNAAFAKKGFC